MVGFESHWFYESVAFAYEEERCPLRVWGIVRARLQVAQQLGLRYQDRMQDWPWEVAAPTAI